MTTRFETALAIQDAGNLRAIAREFVKIVDAAEDATGSTTGTWADPAVIMVANKIADLTGCNNPLTFAKAYEVCCANVAKP